jgi:cell division protein ZapA (FtsZ GTPase activity inhibitor)
MSDPKKIEVTILGKKYPIVTDENESIVKRAAQKVDDCLKAIVEGSGLKDHEMAAKLVALQFAVDTIKQKDSSTRYKTQVSALSLLLSESSL